MCKRYLFSIKGMRKGYLFCQSGIPTGNEFDLGWSLPVQNVVEHPLPLPQKKGNKVGKET